MANKASRSIYDTVYCSDNYMRHYTAISIIYNPRSTGEGKQLAHELEHKLRDRLPRRKITVLPTRHAGHAEELAYTLAKASKRPLIISVSGDGGYNEVVNGAVRAQLEGAQPTTGLMPAGNANDHFRSLHTYELADAAASGHAQIIDVLKLSYTDNGVLQERYAHSYIGLGFTPQAGNELNKNKHRLNRINEIWLVAKILLFFLRPVKLNVRGEIRAYDSLIFSNVSKLGKILTISNVADASDGKFEIIAFRRRNRLRLIFTLFTAWTRGLKGKRQAANYSFRTTKAAMVQLDGEILTLEANAKVTVSIEPKMLRCIV